MTIPKSVYYPCDHHYSICGSSAPQQQRVRGIPYVMPWHLYALLCKQSPHLMDFDRKGRGLVGRLATFRNNIHILAANCWARRDDLGIWLRVPPGEEVFSRSACLA